MIATVHKLPSPTERLVLKAQASLARYLPPDSGITGKECLAELLELFESPPAVRIAQGFGSASDGSLYFEGISNREDG